MIGTSRVFRSLLPRLGKKSPGVLRWRVNEQLVLDSGTPDL